MLLLYYLTRTDFGLKKVPEIVYRVLEEPISKEALQGRSDIPQTLEEFMAEIKETKPDAKAFAVKLRDMVCYKTGILGIQFRLK